MEKQTALQEVTQVMKQAKERRMYERYQAVYLFLKGKSTKEIAEILNRSKETVNSYIRAYESGGLAAMPMKYSPGAPTRLTKEQEEQLKQTIVHSVPHEVGFTARHNWTLEIIAAYIEREFGHRYSLRGVSKMMHRQGLSYTKPTYTLATADPEKQRQFSETTFPELKKDY
jgi:transposase